MSRGRPVAVALAGLLLLGAAPPGDPPPPARPLLDKRAVRDRPANSEQMRDWMPVDVLLARTPAQRRAAMVARIGAEIRAKSKAIDPAALDRVLAAMGRVPREKFVERRDAVRAYLPLSLEIGHGQTISDAYIVALMTMAARVPDRARVLDIGTGSGYQAAVLAALGADVVSIEIVGPLARSAAARLRRLGYARVEVRHGDGFAGAPARAPFDAILVAAGAPAIPPPLLAQLRPGGRLVMPIGPTTERETLIVAHKTMAGAIDLCALGPASFVPLTGLGRSTPPDAGPPVALCFGAPVT